MSSTARCGAHAASTMALLAALSCTSSTVTTPPIQARPERATTTVQVDGTPYGRTTPLPRLAVGMHRVTLTVSVPTGTAVGRYLVGEAGRAWGGTPAEPVGLTELRTGSSLRDGQRVTIEWQPRVRGRRSLVLLYEMTGTGSGRRDDAHTSIGEGLGEFNIV